MDDLYWNFSEPNNIAKHITSLTDTMVTFDNGIILSIYSNGASIGNFISIIGDKIRIFDEDKVHEFYSYFDFEHVTIARFYAEFLFYFGNGAQSQMQIEAYMQNNFMAV